MNAPLYSRIESLEPRIAPAAVMDFNLSIDGKRATWTDVDGDKVTLTASKSVLASNEFDFLPYQDGDLGYQLALLNLSNAHADTFSLTFAAKRDPVTKTGDGCVNVGWINAYGLDLTTLTVPGDLGRLDAGDQNFLTPGVGSITVHSGGMLGALTQDANIPDHAPKVDWSILGRLGALTVKTDFSASLNVLGTDQNGQLGSTGAITIGGDLFANSSDLTDYQNTGAGYLRSSGPMGAVKVKGDVYGGAGPIAGSISSFSSIASVFVGGSMVGGSGNYSGSIHADGILGPVTIGINLVSGTSHDVDGTATPSYAAGSISSAAKVTQVTVSGNVYGGVSFFGGSIFTPVDSHAKIGPVTIKGQLSGSTQIFGSGDTAQLVFNGIYSDSTLGAVKVGSLAGKNSDSPVNIVAKGVIGPATVKDALAIASVTVDRGSYAAQILAGYNTVLSAVNPDVQIGAVKVANNWSASSIAAGVNFGGDIYFGNANDNIVTQVNNVPVADKPEIHSKILSVTVGGYVLGTTYASDSFAIEAQEIGAVKIGATPIELKPNSAINPLDDFFIGITHDFRIREL